MKIKLTPSQATELKEDGYLEIEEPETKTNIYLEFSKDLEMLYGEIRSGYQDKRISMCFDIEGVRKLMPRKPKDPSYYHDYPLCPSCGAYMIMNFPCCPICGQALDWRERS